MNKNEMFLKIREWLELPITPKKGGELSLPTSILKSDKYLLAKYYLTDIPETTKEQCSALRTHFGIVKDPNTLEDTLHTAEVRAIYNDLKKIHGPPEPPNKDEVYLAVTHPIRVEKTLKVSSYLKAARPEGIPDGLLSSDELDELICILEQ